MPRGPLPRLNEGSGRHVHPLRAFEFTLEGRFRACKGPDQPPQSGSLPSALAAMRFASKKLKKIPAKMCQVSSILFGLRGVAFLRPQRPTWCNRLEDDC